MNSVSARSLLWTALAGLVLGILGSGWDRIWHSRHPEGELASASKLLEAHWLIFVGILVLFAALLLAVRSIRQPRSLLVSTWVAFIGSLSTVIGFAWDSTRHIQGTESPGGHAMIYAGTLLVIIGLPAALAFSRNLARPPDAGGNE
jgi:hypothetical protein